MKVVSVVKKRNSRGCECSCQSAQDSEEIRACGSTLPRFLSLGIWSALCPALTTDHISSLSILYRAMGSSQSRQSYESENHWAIYVGLTVGCMGIDVVHSLVYIRRPLRQWTSQ